jgi:hypothetical protein
MNIMLYLDIIWAEKNSCLDYSVEIERVRNLLLLKNKDSYWKCYFSEVKIIVMYWRKYIC